MGVSALELARPIQGGPGNCTAGFIANIIDRLQPPQIDHRLRQSGVPVTESPRGRWLPRAATWLPGLILFLIASIQRMEIRSTGLSVWKGGAFGMFANIDRPRTSREVWLTVTVAGGTPERVGLPEAMQRKVRLAQFVPLGSATDNLLESLRTSCWRKASSTSQSALLWSPCSNPASRPAIAATVAVVNLRYDRPSRTLRTSTIRQLEWHQ